MIPVNQFILGSSDPLLYPSEKMTNSIDEQIAFLQSQKQAINEAYRRNAIPNANNGTTQNQQVVTQGIWDALMRFVNAIKKYYLMMLNLAMFMLQLMLNIMIMLNYLKNGLVVI
jgi:hypothetical protein